MHITSLTLKHTNPSMGPHETVTTISLAAAEPHQARIQQFLEEAVLNNTVSLKDYLEAVHQEDTSILEAVKANAPERDLPSGGTISTFQIHLEGRPTVTLYDVYRRHSLSNFYPDFTKYMVEHGIKISHSPWNDRGPKLKM